MHIRYNETLKYYEYSNTGTDTGPWTKLDLSAHAGAIPPNIAFTNVANQFTVRQQLINVGGGAYHQSAIEVQTATPRIAFHWPGVVASQIGMDTNGVIQVLDNPGTSLEKFSASCHRFPAAQIASAGANDLDDYEEGTFTPTLNGTGLGYAYQNGLYTRIGRLVIWQARIILNGLGSSSGAVFLNLPFVQTVPMFGAGFLGHFAGTVLGGGGWFCFLGYQGTSNGDLRWTNAQNVQVQQVALCTYNC